MHDTPEILTNLHLPHTVGMQLENHVYRSLPIEFTAAERQYLDYQDAYGLPGEQLVLFHHIDPVAFFERIRWFRDTVGLADEQVVASLLCGVPLPVAEKDDLGLMTRWPAASAELLWLPVFWLPEALALRYTVETEDGERVETDDEWAIRVAIELTGSGLYDPETGSWLDVFAAHGIDKDSPDTALRVAGWLEGDSDEQLDAIDLTSYFTLIDGESMHEAALQFALDAAPLGLAAQFDAMAMRLAGRLDSTVYQEANLGDRIERVDEIASMMLLLLSEAELDDGESQVVEVARDARDSVDNLIEGEEELAPEDAWTEVEAIADDLMEALRAVHVEYSPFREAWNAEFEAAINPM